MSTIAIIVALAVGYLLGYHIRELTEKVKALQTKLTTPKPTESDEEPRATFIDPMDIEQQVRWEHEQMMEKLNGKR